MEIERKFLVGDGAPDLERYVGTAMRQGYLIVGDSGEARVRDADGSYTLTFKTGSGLVRGEYEIELTAGQFETLWPATEVRRVEKHRYRLPMGDLVCELDVYDGALEGLVVAEVEFPTVEDSESFEAPAWFDQDVTGVPGYSNAELARDGFPGGGVAR